MTIKNAILSYPGLADIADNYISKVLIDRSFTDDGAADYTLSTKTIVALCAADCYAAIICDPDFSEGKYSQKMSRGAMKAMAKSLYTDNGEPEKANALGKMKVWSW